MHQQVCAKRTHTRSHYAHAHYCDRDHDREIWMNEHCILNRDYHESDHGDHGDHDDRGDRGRDHVHGRDLNDCVRDHVHGRDLNDCVRDRDHVHAHARGRGHARGHDFIYHDDCELDDLLSTVFDDHEHDHSYHYENDHH